MLDHRDIGQKLDLFMFSELSPGSPIWLPKGATIYHLLADKIRRLNQRSGYVEVLTPAIWKPELFTTSGHTEHFRGNMFRVVGQDQEETFDLKPMNCPGHMAIFKARQWSYRDLPYRMHDQGVLHRDEPSGSLMGLMRTRTFCQDDAHIFLALEHLTNEINALLAMVQRVYSAFKLFEVRAVLSTRPDGFLGNPEQWDQAEECLKSCLDQNIPRWKMAKGQGAFYGPKIDFMVKGSARNWQTATIQLDFQLPQRFALKYQAADNTEQTPIVIHRAIYGSFERFIAMLLEQTEGHLPTWLAPIQVRVLGISEVVAPYAEMVHAEFCRCGWRSELSVENATLGAKIRLAEEQRIPIIVICGKREAAAKTLVIRRPRKQEQSNHTLLEVCRELDGERDHEF